MDKPNSSTTNPVPAPIEETQSDSSLTLSLTPPLSDTQKNEIEESSTISEHLSSIENDRSMQEMEVTNVPENFTLLLQNLPLEVERISQEPKPLSLNNSSFNSTSIISLHGLDKIANVDMEGTNDVKSILEEILNNEQFKSESETQEESLNIFANLDLDDKLLNSYNCEKSANFNLGSLKNDSINSYDDVCKRVRDFEELIAVKDTTIAALTSELDSFRELLSNTSSLGTSTTEYKQFQEECHNKLVEYHDAIVHKDELIEKLTTSLQQAILNREEMKQHFKNELGQLQEELEKTSILLKDHKCTQKTDFDFDESCSQLEAILNSSQINLFNELKLAFDQHIERKKKELEEEMDKLKAKFDSEKSEQDNEIARLRALLESAKPDVLELKQELDAKHSKEMEELRTYFEKKCADLEKNYSEEIFSQQSRKMSGSSSCSELSSDFVFNQPGPGGDAKIEYTKKDVTKLKFTLAQMANMLDSFNLNELSDEEFDKLKMELLKFDVRNLLKYDLTLMKHELQNKYHAELEILREDFDNRVDVLNVEHEKKLRELEKKYLDEIEDLNTQLRGRIVTTAQQEVRLVASETIDDEWPEELLQLKARFAEKYKNEIDRLNEEHSEEIAKLKEEHVKTLNAALERARRRSLRDADSLSKGEIELLKERDMLKKQTLSLRNLLGELIKYFTQCEDELNNTLVEELVTKNFTQIEKELEVTTPHDSLNSIKRVHITPNFNDLINLIDNSPDNDLDSIDLKSELGQCLQKLKSEANAILSLSTSFNRSTEKIDTIRRSSSLEKEMSSLTRKLINETQIKNELVEQLNEARSIVQTLETDRGNLENQIEQLLERQKILESDLLEAKGKITELIENGHKEVVSEGYGENGDRTVRGLAEAAASLAALQEKARSFSENPGILEPKYVQLIEDLARVGDKIVEEAKKDHDDLRQQIEAADKKYKVTCQFLEDQAAEREQERDETQKEINRLKEILKDREKDRINCERVSNEVEHLEQQIREMSKLMDATEKRYKEVENERKEAVDKIFELRDIIRELEEQVKVKTTSEDELRSIVNELEVIVKSQASEEALKPREAGGVGDVEKFHQYVDNLESEVRKLRLSSEIAGSEGAIQQIKNHLSDFETTLDKRTKDLEGLHSAVSNTTCSSPSEDMSIRDVVHQEKTIYDECEVPLQQLARLKEKLMRHSRAEDAAVKRIRDLEMQIVALKRELEESSNEREMLKKQIADHLVLISNLQIRLDEQRIRAEHIEKQTNTSLEVQNYDLKNTIASLEERIIKRDKTIAQLNANIEETKRRLEEREMELAANKEDEMVIQMQEQLELLRSENLKLKTKIDKEGQILPNFVEHIISDKNSDIEMLRERLNETEKQLSLFTSLNLDRKEIESLDRMRLSGISFHDLIDLENFEQGRKAKNSIDSLEVSPIVKKSDKTVFLESEPEISTIEKIGPSNLFYSLQVPNQKANSTEKHVRFEDEVNSSKMAELQKEIAGRDELIKNYENRLQKLEELQTKVDQLEVALEETENSLKKAKETFEEEQKQNEDVRLELATRRCELTEKEEELEKCRHELVEEKKNLIEKDKEIKSLQKSKNEFQTILRHKDEEIRIHEETLKVQNEELKKLEDEISELKTQNEQVHKIIEKKDIEITKLKKQIEVVEQTVENKNTELSNLKKENEIVGKELLHFQHQSAEKDKVIEQMKVDYKSVHANLEAVHHKMQETGNVVDLGKRLREEQKKNSALYEELYELKAQLLSVDKKSIEDITAQVQKELDYSAYLDSTLISAVNDGSLESEDLEGLKLSLKKQKSINKQLVKTKEAIEQKYDVLERKYENLKKELDSVQYEDAVLIGDLRTQYDQVVQKKAELEKMSRSEKKERILLESQLKSIKQKMTSLNTKPNSLPDMNHEYKGFTKMISDLEEENSALKQEIKVLKENAKRDLASKDDEIMKLENKITDISYNEKVIQKKYDKVKLDYEAKTNELDRTKKLMEEIDFERKKLAKQVEHRSKSSDPLPEQLMAKIQELNNVAKNDRQMMSVIQGLKNENAILEERLAILENRTSRNLPFDDPVSRANYLFAKCLRMESYRKALIYQKKYLISLLETYQTDVFSDTLGLNTNMDWKKQKRKAQKNRFKCVAIMIVSINRMKYLVRRWHSGRRIVEQRTTPHQVVQFQVGQPVSSQNFSSNVNKATKSALNQPKTDMPWFGTSPPSKEPAGPNKVQSVFSFQPKGSTTKKLQPKKLEPSGYQTTQESGRTTTQNRLPPDSTLNSPLMISKYIERFNQIQDKFGYI